jgi:hypothetical protein
VSVASASGDRYIGSSFSYDLTGGFISVKNVSVPDMAGIHSAQLLQAYKSGTEWVSFQIYTTNRLYAMKKAPTLTELWSATYNATTHKYLRIREASGTTYWDYSADGVSWTNAWSEANPITVTAIMPYFGELMYGSSASTITIVRDDFNILPGLPSVSTQAASGTTDTTTTGNGNITSLNYAASCDKRGVVYGTTTQSAPGNVAPGSSGYDTYAEDTGTYSTGAFTKGVTGLSESTQYFMRAYTHNVAGYAYGDEVNFTTTGAGSSAIKTVNGLAIASVKTKDGLAISSVKNINGLA